ncbi:MAG: hypothetical protein ACNA7H_06015 [Desulfotignum sp.]
MQVVFFPFSHVDCHQQNTLAAFFSRFVFLPAAPDLKNDPAMVPWVEKQAALPVFTPENRCKAVASRVRSWLDWAALHQGNEQNLKALFRDTPYLLDGSGTAAIQSELRGRITQNDPPPVSAPPPVDPLLFVTIAKITDAENEAVDRDLAGLEKKQAALFSGLLGDASPLAGRGAQNLRDPGAVMTRERIRAWAACAREHALFDGPDPLLLATTSDAVFDRVVAEAAQVINALDINNIKVHEGNCGNRPGWQQQVLAQLQALAAGPGSKDPDPFWAGPDDSCRMSGQIQARVVSGPDLEKNLNLPQGPVTVCRVAVN